MELIVQRRGLLYLPINFLGLYFICLIIMFWSVCLLMIIKASTNYTMSLTWQIGSGFALFHKKMKYIFKDSILQFHLRLKFITIQYLTTVPQLLDFRLHFKTTSKVHLLSILLQTIFLLRRI